MQRGDQAFYRGNDRIIGGVCSGLAAGLHVDPIWIRVAFFILAFVQGIGLFIYIVLWLVMPERVEGASPRSGLESMADDMRRVGREVQGLFGGIFGSSPSTPSPGEPAPAPPPPPPPTISGPRTNESLLLGVILFLIGAVLLAANTGIVPWTVIWPAALIIIGVVLLIRTIERRA